MKKIQEFIMQCSDVKQRDEVISILKVYGVTIFYTSFSESNLCLHVFDCDDEMRFICHSKIKCKFELIITYSEFMKLYGNIEDDTYIGQQEQSDLLELKDWITKTDKPKTE